MPTIGGSARGSVIRDNAALATNAPDVSKKCRRSIGPNVCLALTKSRWPTLQRGSSRRLSKGRGPLTRRLMLRESVRRCLVLGSLVTIHAAPAWSQRGDAAAQREDLAAFRRDFLAVDQSFTPAARAEAERRLASLDAAAGSISDTRFVLSLEQIAALADNGHTRVAQPWSAVERVGVRLAPFGTDFYVLRVVAEHADLLGGRLVAIDGIPIDRLRDSARTLTGGTPARRDRFVPATLESLDQLSAFGLIRK